MSSATLATFCTFSDKPNYQRVCFVSFPDTIGVHSSVRYRDRRHGHYPDSPILPLQRLNISDGGSERGPTAYVPHHVHIQGLP